MFTIIDLPDNFIASTTGAMSQLITDLSPYLTLVIGVILSILIISILIDTLKR